MRNPNIDALLNHVIGKDDADFLFGILNRPSILEDSEEGQVTRAELAQAMNMGLFSGLLKRSANGKRYTDEVVAQGGRVYFDHGALRTVRWAANGALPPGEAAFTRILRPLGFVLAGRYPLDRIGMTGRAYSHADCPDEMSQFFLSELHPERFSGEFQQAVTRVLDTSRDPLTPQASAWLSELERDGSLPLNIALQLLPILLACFERQHSTPHLADYEILLKESAEMAWLATEGNAFNHVTDRVADVHALSERERSLGKPIKEDVEASRSGRVFQTAYRADPVLREFIDGQGQVVTRTVPGSFYEFITRKRQFDLATRRWTTDLRFDAGNAQGIFKMTAAS